MNRIEHNPRKLQECAECGEIITDGCCYRLNDHEVVCLTCYIEVCTFLWTAGWFYNQTTP